MQLLILILNEERTMDKVLAEMMNEGLRGGSLLECEGVLQALGHTSVEPPPIFGSLRQYLNPEHGDTHKMLIAAIKDEQYGKVKEIVDDVTGGLNKANVGIMMTLPIGNIEGFNRE